MRRYRSLGLLRKSRTHGPIRNLRNQVGVSRFVSESQIQDLILFRRLARARPALQSLQFATDDVDWQLEYFCDLLGKWIMRILGWILWLFQSLANFFLPQYQRKKTEDIPPKKEHKEGKDDDDDARHIRRVNRMNYDVVGRKQWKYDECRPFHKRRVIKRKWFLKPETKDWALETLKLYHRHVNRGFRSLCSGIGKDTKIYVIDPDSPTPKNTFVFAGDARTLSAQSELFNWWFEESGSKREIETGFVTPDEMEAILVYIYTLTWPVSMMTCKHKPEIGSRSKRKTLDRRFLEILELYGMSLKLTKENPYQTESEDVSPFQIFTNYGNTVSNEDILYDSFFHPNLQYIFCHSGSGFEGQGDCHFVSEVQVTLKKKKRMNTAHDKMTLPKKKHSSLETEDNSNVKRSFQRLSNPFLRRVHPETVSTMDRGGANYSKTMTKNDEPC